MNRNAQSSEGCAASLTRWEDLPLREGGGYRIRRASWCVRIPETWSAHSHSDE